MKCDVCHTKIPLGSYVCPNCGMTVKKAGTTHVHSEGNHCEDTHEKTDIFTKASVSGQKKFRTVSFTIPIISVIIIAVLAISIFMDIGSLIPESNNQSIPNSIVSNVHDEYQKIADWKIEDLENLGLKVDKNSGMTIYPETTEYDINIYATKDDLEYTIYYTYDAITETSVSLEITGSYEGNVGQSVTYLNEDFINLLGDYLGFDNTYSLFKDGHENMIDHEENPGHKYYIGYADEYEVYVKENNGEDYNTTLFTYSICK